jgi:hypothetical protein
MVAKAYKDSSKPANRQGKAIEFDEALRRLVNAPPQHRVAPQRQNDDPGDPNDPRRPDRRDA